jgi:hypothetical protein
MIDHLKAAWLVVGKILVPAARLNVIGGQKDFWQFLCHLANIADCSRKSIAGKRLFCLEQAFFLKKYQAKEGCALLMGFSLPICFAWELFSLKAPAF